MPTTREQILEILATQRMATAAELSRALQVSQADIRHHLGMLVKEKLVEKAGNRTTGERGRPRSMYRLTTMAQPDNIAGLADGLLSAAQNMDLHELLKATAVSLASGKQSALSTGARLYEAVQRLNELNYQAHWEAHAEAPILQLSNCPYAILIHEHPELCQMDKFLIEQLSGMTAEQTAKLETSAQGSLHCIFQLIPNQKKRR